MTSRTSRFSCDIRLADMACDSARAVGPGALVSSRRQLGWLEGKVKFSGFRRRGPLRIRYVPFSLAIEGEFWVARWVRKLDIEEAVRVVVDGVTGMHLQDEWLQARTSDCTSTRSRCLVIVWRGISPVVDEQR